MIQVRPVVSPKDLKAFLKVPFRIYQDNPYWVPPILLFEKDRFNPRKNPYYHHAEVQLFLAEKDGVPVGRIVAHIDHNYNRFHDEETGMFGFFESVNDPQVAHALLQTAESWVRDHGMNFLLGPLSFSTNEEAGLLVEGFEDPPVIMNPYHPPYYKELLESYGLRKMKDLLCYLITIDETFRQFADRLRRRLLPIAQKARETGYRIRNANFRDFKNEVLRIMEIYNSAWERNWGFVPLTEEEIWRIAEELKPITMPELVKIVEKDGKPVAFGLLILDANQAIKPLKGRLFPFGLLRLYLGLKRVDRLRLLALGIKKGYRKQGVDALLYLSMMDTVLAMGRFKSCDVSWLLEDNYLIIRATEFMRGKHYKTLRIYGKPVE